MVVDKKSKDQFMPFFRILKFFKPPTYFNFYDAFF